MCRCISDVSVGRKVISVSYSSAILPRPHRCISDVFVGRKVFSTSYSSTILKLLSHDDYI